MKMDASPAPGFREIHLREGLLQTCLLSSFRSKDLHLRLLDERLSIYLQAKMRGKRQFTAPHNFSEATLGQGEE